MFVGLFIMLWKQVSSFSQLSYSSYQHFPHQPQFFSLEVTKEMKEEKKTDKRNKFVLFCYQRTAKHKLENWRSWKIQRGGLTHPRFQWVVFDLTACDSYSDTSLCSKTSASLLSVIHSKRISKVFLILMSYTNALNKIGLIFSFLCVHLCDSLG